MDFNKGHLISFYEEIENKRVEQKEYIEKVQKIDNELQIKLLEYRINSVCRVLKYLVGLDNDINELLTHCINKLNGNNDGIELNLEEE